MARSAGDALACAAAGTPPAAGAAVRHFGAPDVRSPPAAMPATSVAASPIPRMGSSCQAFPIPRVFMRLFRPGGAGIAFRRLAWPSGEQLSGVAGELPRTTLRWASILVESTERSSGCAFSTIRDHPKTPGPGGEREAVHAVPSRDR